MDLTHYAHIREYNQVDADDKRKFSCTDIFRCGLIIMYNRERDKNVETLLGILEGVSQYKENKKHIEKKVKEAPVEKQFQEQKAKIPNSRVETVIRSRSIEYRRVPILNR